jgi:hypothetical protein
VLQTRVRSTEEQKELILKAYRERASGRTLPSSDSQLLDWHNLVIQSFGVTYNLELASSVTYLSTTSRFPGLESDGSGCGRNWVRRLEWAFAHILIPCPGALIVKACSDQDNDQADEGVPAAASTWGIWDFSQHRKQTVTIVNLRQDPTSPTSSTPE